MVEWSEHFFEGVWQDVQLQHSSDEDNRATAQRIARALDLEPSSRVLDAPCGDGRISLELAAFGHQVTGIDITERFLGEAQKKSGARALNIRWERQDIRELPYEAEFDAVINFGGSFGYFDEAENRQVAACMWRALRPGGRFLVDAPCPETVFPNFRERYWSVVGDLLVVRENRYDHDTGRIDSDWTIVADDGSRDTRRSSMRLYTYRELTDLLRSVGFRQITGYDADGESPFRLGAERLLMVATKSD